jgi:hypothetical protein
MCIKKIEIFFLVNKIIFNIVKGMKIPGTY